MGFDKILHELRLMPPSRYLAAWALILAREILRTLTVVGLSYLVLVKSGLL